MSSTNARMADMKMTQLHKPHHVLRELSGTAGLDSFAALNIMEHMALLAKLGHTIIATIHQPRAAIWAMFHKVGAACLDHCIDMHASA